MVKPPGWLFLVILIGFYQEQNEWNQKEAPLNQWRETHISHESHLVSSAWNRWDACRPCGMQCVGTVTSSVIWRIDVISAFSLFDWQYSSSAAKNVILDQKAEPQPMDRRDWACQQVSLSEKPEEEWCSLQVREEEHTQKKSYHILWTISIAILFQWA